MYIVNIKKGFMAHQFGDIPVYCTGIDCATLNHVLQLVAFIGKEKRRIFVSLNIVSFLIKKYGRDKIIRYYDNLDKNGSKNPVYVIPVFEVEQLNRLGNSHD